MTTPLDDIIVILETIFTFFLFCILLLWIIIVKLRNLIDYEHYSVLNRKERKKGKCLVSLLSCTKCFFLAPFPNSHYCLSVMQCKPSLYQADRMHHVQMCCSVPVWVTVCMFNYFVLHSLLFPFLYLNWTLIIMLHQLYHNAPAHCFDPLHAGNVLKQ